MRTKKPSYPYPLVRVLWVDAATSHGWESKDEREQTVPLVTTIGFLIHENEHLICVASTIGDSGDHNARISIPIGMVKEKTIL